MIKSTNLHKTVVPNDQDCRQTLDFGHYNSVSPHSGATPSSSSTSTRKAPSSPLPIGTTFYPSTTNLRHPSLCFCLQINKTLVKRALICTDISCKGVGGARSQFYLLLTLTFRTTPPSRSKKEVHVIFIYFHVLQNYYYKLFSWIRVLSPTSIIFSC